MLQFDEGKPEMGVNNRIKVFIIQYGQKRYTS